ncbi:DUF3263 domain-containing protein [Micromonospora sp. RTGN7]|uniref:DUF3263 domain-containing protein n=1 Tax=Micromonospora sp. RTGN7 TaxID=3016526 RepID=UPI0029FEE164|nr:DUF3263 domain-containing protein [Micromonospora sp. RTGN7]
MSPADASPAATDRPEPSGPAGRRGEAGREATGVREGVTVPPPRAAPESSVPAFQPRAAPESSAPASDGAVIAPGADAAVDAGLTEREVRILAFEQQWWRHAGAKEQAIRDAFGLSATRYYQLLNGLLDNPAALAAEPMLVGRLRRLRSSRARNRRR